MPRINCEQRMREFLEDLDADSISGLLMGGIELDIHEECVEEWSRDYAIGLIDINEPDNAMFLNVDEVVDKLVGRAAKRFGKTFEVVRGSGEAKSNQVLHVHRIGSWTLELEAYRKTEKKEVDECDES